MKKNELIAIGTVLRASGRGDLARKVVGSYEVEDLTDFIVNTGDIYRKYIQPNISDLSKVNWNAVLAEGLKEYVKTVPRFDKADRDQIKKALISYYKSV